MLDDNKRQDRVPINLTEREFADVCREALRMDKKPAEFIHFILRKSLYGSIGMVKDEGNQFKSAE